MHPSLLTWQGFGENHRSYHRLAARAVLIGERPGTAPPHFSVHPYSPHREYGTSEGVFSLGKV